jgi:HrpA-like RNA helicase
MSAIAVNEAGLMNRPTRYDECVQRRAAEIVLPEIKRWLNDPSWATDEEIIQDLMECLGEGDGYKICDELKRKHSWECDSQLVEILDGWVIDDAEKELVKQWVKCLGVKLDIPIGTHVRIKHYKSQSMSEFGEVVKHYPEEAKYGVRTPDQDPTANWILLLENIEAVV